MSPHDRASFGEVRSLLQRPRDPAQLWPQLCELLVEVDLDEQLRGQVGSYARAHALAWPARDRPLPLPWLERILRGQPTPQARLAGWLDTSPRGMRLEDIGAEVLASSQDLEGLRIAHLRHQLVHLEGLGSILAAPWLEGLVELALDGNLLGDRGARAITRRAPLPRLDRLSLRAVGMARGGLLRLLDSSLMLRLRALDVARNDLGWRCAPAIAARGARCVRLQTLGLRRTGLGPEDAGPLGDLLARAPALTSLDLDENRLGAQALITMLERAQRSPLHALSLRETLVGPTLTARLPELAPDLRELCLGEREIEPGVLAGLAGLTRLESVSIRRGVRSVALAELAELELPALRSLELRSGELSREALERLTRAPWMPQLTHLALENLGLGAAHIEALAQAPWHANARLELRMNALESGDLGPLLARDLEVTHEF